MKEQLKKKKSDDDMLIVHKPPQPKKNDRKKGGEVNKYTLVEDIGLLASQLEKTDENERTELIMEIQERWGNDFASKVVEELEQRKTKKSKKQRVLKGIKNR